MADMGPVGSGMAGAGADPDSSPGPGPGGGFPAAQPSIDPKIESGMMAVRDMTAATRRLAMQFPQLVAEMRQINDIIARAMQKVQGSGPAPTPMTPPI